MQDLERVKEYLLPNSRHAQILDAFAGPSPGMVFRSSGVTGPPLLKSITERISWAISCTGRWLLPEPIMMQSSSMSATPVGPRDPSLSRGRSSLGISLMDLKSIVFLSYCILPITGKLQKIFEIPKD